MELAVHSEKESNWLTKKTQKKTLLFTIYVSIRGPLYIHVQEVWVAVGQLPQLVHQDNTTQTAQDRALHEDLSFVYTI